MKTPKASPHKLFTDFAQILKRVDKALSAKEVHVLRTTARRIEALTAHLPTNIPEKSAAVLEEIHAVRKRSGKVRDFDVQLGLLRKVGSEAYRTQFEALENHLLEKRERRADKLMKEVKVLRRKKWLAKLEKLSEQVSGDSSSRLKKGAPLEAAKEQLRILAARYPDSVSMVDPEELHQLRIEIKKIRYTAELAGRSVTTRSFTTAMEAAQDVIGEWHDWLTLAETAEEVLNNYVSNGILQQLRSLTTQAYSAAIQSVTESFAGVATLAKKAPRGAAAKSRITRSA